jgi:uncharacterized protein YkuJ
LINIKKTRILITFLLSAGIFFAGSLSVIAVGDIMMGSDYPSKNLPSNQGRDLFTKIDSTLMGADLTLGNLEGTLLTGGVCTKKIQKGRCYAFRTPPGWAENLLNAGFDFMNLANNHMNDFGAGGIKATKKALSDVGLTYGGAYSEVGQFEINGNKVAIVSFSTSPNTNSIFEIPKAQRNVVKFSRAVVDSGADFVWGHGPHVPRAMEIYNDRLIAYSLGNFFTWGFNLGDERGYTPILKVVLDSTGVFQHGKIISAIQRTYKYLALDSLHRAAKLVKELSAQDFPESTPIISDQGMIYPRTKK